MAQMKNISEFNKLRVQLFIEAVLNEGRLDLIDELIAADFVGHIPCAEPEVTGPAGVRQLVSGHRHAHPGLHIKIEDQIAEEDRVVTRWHATVPAPRGSGSPRPRRAHCVLRRNLDHPAPGRKANRFAHRMHRPHHKPGPGGKDRRMAHSITGNPCLATQPCSRKAAPTAPKQKEGK